MDQSQWSLMQNQQEKTSLKRRQFVRASFCYWLLDGLPLRVRLSDFFAKLTLYFNRRARNVQPQRRALHMYARTITSLHRSAMQC